MCSGQVFCQKSAPKLLSQILFLLFATISGIQRGGKLMTERGFGNLGIPGLKTMRITPNPVLNSSVSSLAAMGKHCYDKLS